MKIAKNYQNLPERTPNSASAIENSWNQDIPNGYEGMNIV